MNCQVRDVELVPKEQVNPGDPDKEIRVYIKSWLLRTMKQRNLSAEKWAKLAGISGTTITRFLNTDDPRRTPNSATIEKLKRAAGVPGLHEPQQVLIALVRRDTLLEAARRLGTASVDLFTMPPDDYVPAPERYRDCRLQEMDNGRFAICREAAPVVGKRVLVLHGDKSIAPYWYTPPMLVPLYPSEVAGPVAADDPAVKILGRTRGEYMPYPDEDD